MVGKGKNYKLTLYKMEIKLFGKKIFEFGKDKAMAIEHNSMQKLEESKFLPDFYTMREHVSQSSDLMWTVATPNIISTSVSGALGEGQTYVLQTRKEEKELKAKTKLTPKRVHELKFLNMKDFRINVDPAYVDLQVQHFRDKLNLIRVSEFDMSRGTNEIASILKRMENRKQYEAHKDFFEDFAYTTTERVNKVLKNHSHLKLGQVEQFVADMPREATEVMKSYNARCFKMCGKQAVFYIIADKKDFERSEKRRDPILLAQSPFGHVWQILGAWDEEMLLLEEL